MPEVVLIRPGCTDFDEQNRIQGSLDLPLNVRGQQQVESLVQQLRTVSVDVVCSGPCEPARSTAVAISEECGAAYKEVEDLRNLDHGLWQGLQVDDVRRKYPKVFKQWQELPETVCLPGGETVADAVARIQRALRKVIKRKKTVAIVASEPLATLIRCVLCGCRPELPQSGMNNNPERMIERIKVPDEEAAAQGATGSVRPPMGAAPPKGEPKNGATDHPAANAPSGNGNLNGTKPPSKANRANGNGTPTEPAAPPQGTRHELRRQA